MEFKVLGKGAGNYVVNDKAYGQEGNSDATVRLNTAEQWELSNNTSNHGGSPHPFHIHVNPFLLEGDLIVPVEDGGENVPSNWRWWDTFFVDPGTTHLIRHRFWDYPGEFVMHCHILIHEDQGMMINVKVNDDPSNPGIGPCCSLPESGESECYIPRVPRLKNKRSKFKNKK